jgi:hypothetical protein
MKQTRIALILATLCASALAGEPKKSITTQLHDTVNEVTFRVESITSDPPLMHIIRQYVVLHSVTDGARGLGYRITSLGHPSRIEAYQFDTKTGKRLPAEDSVNHVLTNVYDLLLSNKTLAVGNEYIFSFQQYDGYLYLVDVRKKEPPTTPRTVQ